ncbi:MAG: septum formation initiator family protein [bacterium]|jgi:cell division protein FtsL
MIRRRGRRFTVNPENENILRFPADRPRRRPWLKAALALILLYVGVLLGVQQYRLYQINQKIAAVKSEIAAAQQQKAELEVLAENLQTDEYIEMIARKRLGLVKPGEIQYYPVPIGTEE